MKLRYFVQDVGSGEPPFYVGDSPSEAARNSVELLEGCLDTLDMRSGPGTIEFSVREMSDEEVVLLPEY